ncbi:unnamed protein product [Pocillopora meandrina]|uniref:Uncharacterized protein n=1 Tax=Pocillopora meandrina TaxID=46732 RepID=A0AAU9WEQ3_9CNID|nr:unnamed protein product [Pocillopora meandrina]
MKTPGKRMSTVAFDKSVKEAMERIYFLALTFSFVTGKTVAKPNCLWRVLNKRTFTSLSVVNRRPPEITNFTQKDLVNPDDVKSESFELPCGAAGTNLSWTWKHNDTELTSFRGSLHYFLNKDGTLIGKKLSSQHSGTYQCIVKDKDTKIEVFSRKVTVFITVHGEFIDSSSKNVTVDLGKPLRLHCPKHTAGFGTVYIWVKPSNIYLSRNEGRGISPNGTLFIANLTQKDIDEVNEGGIMCRIRAGTTFEDSGKLSLEKNPLQKDPNTSVTLSWAAGPAVDELAIEGRQRILYCFANGRPAPQITWKKNGQQIVDGQNSFEVRSYFYGRRLVITNVNRESHQDNYTCEANNSRGNVDPIVRRINLEVKVPPRWNENPPPSEISIIIDKNDTIECQVVADPVATILWYKNGVHLQSSSDRVIVDGSKLHFRNVNLTDEGVYQCAVENQYGMIVSATWVQVKAWKPSFDNRQFGPFHLRHGHEGTLRCNPNAEPRPKFQWFVDGVLISDGAVNSRYRLLLNGTLVIKTVDKDKDAVNYTCNAVNMMGKASATTVPTVLVTPFFVTKPRNKTVLEKGTTAFYCNVNGHPLPNITWVKDGVTVGNGSTLRFETTWRRLSGRYWCHAQNGLSVAINASAFLNVQCKYLTYPGLKPTSILQCNATGLNLYSRGAPFPWSINEYSSSTRERFQTLECCNPSIFSLTFAVLSYFQSRPANQSVQEGDEASFHCGAMGNPTPKISWFKDGRSVGTGNTLSFVAFRNRSGEYWCSANNGLGSAINASAQLNVQNVPSPPINVTITDCKDWSVKLHWVQGPSTDGAPITHYLIEQESGEDPVVFSLLHNVSKSDLTSMTFNISLRTSSRFRIKAVNNVGESLPSSTVKTTCQGTIGERQKEVKKTHIYQKAWFLIMLALIACVVLISALALLFISYYKGKGKKYEVGKRERERGYTDEAKQLEENVEDEEANNLGGNAEKTPLERRQNRNSRPVSSLISLLEFQFREDGSFTEEYGGEDDLLQGTFV